MMKDMAGVDRSSYAQNPELTALAFDLTRVGGGIVDASQKAAQALLATRIPVDGETSEAMPGADLSKPFLSPPMRPVPLENGMSSAAKLTQLLGELNALLGEMGQSELEGRIALFRDMANARKESLEKVSQEFAGATDSAQEAVTLSDAAKGVLAMAEAESADAKAQAKDAEAALAELTEQVASGALENDDPALRQALLKNDAALVVLRAATQKLGVAVDNHQRLLLDAVGKANIAMDIEKRSMASAAAASNTADRPEHLGSSAARLTLLMASLTQIIGESRDASMKNDQALFEEMQMQRQKSLEKSAADYEAEVAKAEQVNKTMGCIGKIVGAILTVVSIVAIPFTGGASAALAVIGVGLMVADKIVEAATGKSLTDMAMAPIMTHIIQPMMEAISKIIVAALESYGVPPEKAKLVGGVIAAVVTAVIMLVVMVAVSALAKGAATRMMEKFAKPMVNMMSKMATKIAAKMQTGTAARFGAVAETGGTVLGGAGATIQAGGGIAASVFMKEAADHEADLVISTNVMEQLERYLRDAVDNFSSSLKMTQNLTVTASDAAQREADTGRFVLRRMRG